MSVVSPTPRASKGLVDLDEDGRVPTDIGLRTQLPGLVRGR